MSEQLLMSALGPSGMTHTSAHSMEVARQVSAAIRDRLGHGRLSARLVPDAKANAVLVLLEAKCTSRLWLWCEVESAHGAQMWDAWVATRTEMWLPMPDFAEALHMIGIILEDLGASIASLGLRTAERNHEVLLRPIAPGEMHGDMDRCDFAPQAQGAWSELPSGQLMHVTSDWTFTPRNVFNWVCLMVARAQQYRSAPLRAHLWGRRSGQRGLSNAEQDVPRGAEQIVLYLSDGKDLYTSVIFEVGEVCCFRLDSATVVSAVDAIHLAGMIVEGIGAVSLMVGMNDSETNPVVFARPSPRAGWTSRVSASNIVMPLEQAGGAQGE